MIDSTRGSSAPVGYHFPREVIAVAVRWYLRYGLSYRDVDELLDERGISVDHVTIYRRPAQQARVRRSVVRGRDVREGRPSLDVLGGAAHLRPPASRRMSRARGASARSEPLSAPDSRVPARYCGLATPIRQIVPRGQPRPAFGARPTGQSSRVPPPAVTLTNAGM